MQHLLSSSVVKIALYCLYWHQVVQLPEICDWQLWRDVDQCQPEIKKGVQAQFLRHPAVILFGRLPWKKLLEMQQTP